MRGVIQNVKNRENASRERSRNGLWLARVRVANRQITRACGDHAPSCYRVNTCRHRYRRARRHSSAGEYAEADANP